MHTERGEMLASVIATFTPFEHNNAGKEPAARSVGTTVTVKELFKTLPVRYKTFQRGVKREFVKLAQLLHAYALVATGVKMVATNQVRGR